MSARQRPNMTIKERPVLRISPKNMFLLAKHIRRSWLRARAGSQELGVPLAEHAASLRFQTSAPLTPQRGGHEPQTRSTKHEASRSMDIRIRPKGPKKI